MDNLETLFETILNAEIGNGKVYTPAYNASDRMNYRGEGWSGEEGTQWTDIRQVNIAPSKKKMIGNVVQQLTPPEKKALDAFNPNPPDISVDVDSGKAAITFPNGQQKTVRAV